MSFMHNVMLTMRGGFPKKSAKFDAEAAMLSVATVLPLLYDTMCVGANGAFQS
jgi:hypothetical protein